ncbi:Trm112 family protein [Alkalilimnicola sp. S0819]|uniref:Trm112 family protein n=1 Tax=Alkalilimnicola sp. S0819 TaxID=2613922 RepID=UPI001D02FC9D|nr:Trm112 family protein [Alkalilimnicola sp. S0819]
MDKKLLDILCCPVTKQPVKVLSRDKLKTLNARIAEGSVRSYGDEPVRAALTEALVTDNGERIYPVEDGIPIMLQERGISAREAGLK